MGPGDLPARGGETATTLRPRSRRGLTVAERQVLADAELAAAAVLLAWNAAINRAVPAPAYVPANLAAAGLSVLAARRRQVPAADLGLGRDRPVRGLLVGLAASALVAAVVLGATAPDPALVPGRAGTPGERATRCTTPWSDPLGHGGDRGTLSGGAARHPPPAPLRAGRGQDSVLFGRWHVLPTLDTLGLNAAGSAVRDDLARTAAAVAASWPPPPWPASASPGCASGAIAWSPRRGPRRPQQLSLRGRPPGRPPRPAPTGGVAARGRPEDAAEADVGGAVSTASPWRAAGR